MAIFMPVKTVFILKQGPGGVVYALVSVLQQ